MASERKASTPQSWRLVKRVYSGKSSEKFWKRINAIPQSEGGMQLYQMGCILQDVEWRVLGELERIESKSGRESRG